MRSEALLYVQDFKIWSACLSVCLVPSYDQTHWSFVIQIVIGMMRASPINKYRCYFIVPTKRAHGSAGRVSAPHQDGCCYLFHLPCRLWYKLYCISYSVYWYSAHSNSEETGRERKTDKILVLSLDFVLVCYFKVVAAVVDCSQSYCTACSGKSDHSVKSSA